MKVVPKDFTSPFERLRWVLKALRAPDGCPWDREQTLQSIQPCLQEECYELLAAMVDDENLDNHREELGDVLLQVLFQCDIREDEGSFTFDDVATVLADKLIRRHPHVFGDVNASDTETVLKNWETIKQTEHKTPKASALDGVPVNLPALLKAQRTQHKAAKVGFDWKDADGPEAKIVEELAELRQAIASGNQTAIEDEYGDVLFSIVNLARHIHVDAESALRAATEKFARRFRAVESRVKAEGKVMKDLSLEALDQVWDAVKAEQMS
ncbi:MAG: nucleoside triphosphate pyrophosphohydrolase [bacterium]|nr:nucleoside triphosphate pyrophosphohydrolase [bacterium]MDO5462920.1 nucleoside triphosphate pyrophosphohydrolase [bacterium]